MISCVKYSKKKLGYVGNFESCFCRHYVGQQKVGVVFGGKFRDVPLEVITVMDKQFSSILRRMAQMEGSPEPRFDLTPEEKAKLRIKTW